MLNLQQIEKLKQAEQLLAEVQTELTVRDEREMKMEVWRKLTKIREDIAAFVFDK